MLTAEEVRMQMNLAGRKRQPFLFGVDFEMKHGFFSSSPQNERDILFSFGNAQNGADIQKATKQESLKKDPIPYADYLQKFNIVHHAIRNGDSFLLNLSLSTPITTDLNLLDIFSLSHAPYKVWMKDRFVCFSPETFVKINPQGEIFSYPMKGTISTSIPHAEDVLLSSYKETCEHYTIVDLIRNDLNRVAKHVAVSKFRYIDKIRTQRGEILQTSSEVKGQLPLDFHHQIGDIIWELLPAGSISGAPKQSTLEIIQKAEINPRGYYTGIAGYFDGYSLDSGVLIRFVEQVGDRLFFRSGGGITINSNPEEEYQEIIDKVYFPFY